MFNTDQEKKEGRMYGQTVARMKRYLDQMTMLELAMRVDELNKDFERWLEIAAEAEAVGDKETALIYKEEAFWWKNEATYIQNNYDLSGIVKI